MGDRTEELINLYQNSEIEWSDGLVGLYKYRFRNKKNNMYITQTMNTEIYVYFYEIDGVCPLKRTPIYPRMVDQNHPEIKKIRKRLEFLNKL